MIFFQKKIEPFYSANGMKLSPIPCELVDGREGYYLGEEHSISVLDYVDIIEKITSEKMKKIDENGEKD